MGDLSTGDVTNTSTNIAEVGDVHTGDVETTLEAAPSVYLATPPSTAQMMKCVGLGGSSQDGAATGVWCWLQKDLYARDRAVYLKDIDPQAAAQAYCGRPLHYKDFGTEAECRARFASGIVQGAVHPPFLPVSPAPVDENAGRLLERIEALEKQLNDQRTTKRQDDQRRQQALKQLEGMWTKAQ